MTSENVAEHEAVESAADLSAKAVDDQLIDKLVSRAPAAGLQLTGEGGLLQQLTALMQPAAPLGGLTRQLTGTWVVLAWNCRSPKRCCCARPIGRP
ncbi:hypothetical protein ACFYOV_17855 [Streptomyces sp. NPDC005931]|uniref:hypothetical protein n=1 Tax=Streptomyces sp. NPDC005931 TaxID=3364737 RepID=UPI0036D1683A